MGGGGGGMGEMVGVGCSAARTVDSTAAVETRLRAGGGGGGGSGGGGWKKREGGNFL
jgi:hypothetical protein